MYNLPKGDGMHNRLPSEACYVFIDDVARAEQKSRRRRSDPGDSVADPWSYWAKRGRATLRLSLIEYRILEFLAAKPNQAFTHRRIVAAVSTHRHFLTVETLPAHIHSLRGHLGFYSDYIQAVPHIGYRFKA